MHSVVHLPLCLPTVTMGHETVMAKAVFFGQPSDVQQQEEEHRGEQQRLYGREMGIVQYLCGYIKLMHNFVKYLSCTLLLLLSISVGIMGTL